MVHHSFVLEKYRGRNTRHTCPNCGSKIQFTRYIHVQTREYLDSRVGRCNREHKCGYHFTPQQYFRRVDFDLLPPTSYCLSSCKIERRTERPSRIPDEIFTKSFHYTTENKFVRRLSELYGADNARILATKYFIGNCSYWPGSTICWQVDVKGHIRAGKVIDYDDRTLKRIPGRVNWVHKISNLKNYHLKQCFFGEHLLVTEPNKKVAIVEGEKTAIIASRWLPEYLWLATGGLNNLTPDRFKPLHGRDIILFPDLGAFNKWERIAHEISLTANIRISRLLEDRCSDSQKKEGLDIGDFLLGLTN